MKKVNSIARSISEIATGAIIASVFITHSENFKIEIIILTIALLVRRLTDEN
jgi:hypothetical protein